MKNNYKYKFSIIMSIYNVENYLEEAIESIINQNIGFEENVQLILVNDGSPDASGVICEKYLKKYPNNIIYKKKKNGGLSSSKNVGLKYIKGKYVNFFDSDDTLPVNVLSEVYNFFKRNELCIDFVTIPLCFFEAEKGLHPKYKYMAQKNRIINLESEPYNFVLSGAASFYKREVFKNFRFDESFCGEEDTQLNGTLYLKNPRFGYVCEKGVRYNYRKRFSKSSIADTAKLKPESFRTVVRMLDSIIVDNNLKDYQKELIIYEIRSRLKNINPNLFDTKEEYDKIINDYRRFISLIDTNYIIKNSKYCDSVALKYLFLKLSNKSLDDIKNLIYNSTAITIQKVNIIKNKLIMDVTFNNYGFNSLDVVSFDGENNIYEYVESKKFNGPFDVKIGEFSLANTQLRRFVFELNSTRMIKFILLVRDTSVYYPARSVIVNSKSRFDSVMKCIYYRNYKISFNGRKFSIKKCKNNIGKLKSLKRLFSSVYYIKKNYNYLAITRLFNRKRKKYILINDRINKASDNGEALFKYINDNRNDLIKNTYYVISKSSSDYKRLKKIGNVVATGSLKHKILFLNAAYVYSSHTMPEYFNAYKLENLKYYKDLFDYKFVWLQHGITQNDISIAANSYRKGIDYIIACVDKEFVEFKEDKYCYDNDRILLTGFARYDYLKNEPKNIITIAPTWRRGLGESLVNKDDFESTEYFSKYSELLSNKLLLKKLSSNNLKINFILHPEMISYIDSFKKYENELIKIVSLENINYSEVFATSKLFITDYSSVLFDFAYLKKPEIYYQFDQEKFYSTHYKKGYFDFEKNAFGDVLKSEKDIINKIFYYIDNNFVMEKKYVDRVDSFFKYLDNDNCKRILDATIKSR